VLLANYGNEVPSRESYELQGIHTWDDGQGIFIRKSAMRARILTILIEGPEKNILTLSAKMYAKLEKLPVSEHIPEFDLLKKGEMR
jgi:hypothetical protein